MIYEFKSRVTGTVVMNKGPAEWILGVIGKQPGPQGIITVEQMPAAIEALRRAIEEDKRAVREARRESAHREEEEEGDDKESPAATVTHVQRAWPFVEMLLEAQKGGREITWGV
jgi:Sec-independent protein translocase protein TatA